MASSRLAVVGCGSITERGILPHLQLRGTQAVALCDVNQQRMGNIASHYGIANCYTSLEKLLQDDVCDAVAIATPIPLHYLQAKQCIAAGKHAYLQKTMTTTYQEAFELTRLAQARGVKLAASPGMMLLPLYKAAAQILNDGGIGEPYQCLGTFTALGHEYEANRRGGADPTWYYQPGGGPLKDMGVYGLHAVIGLLGNIDQGIGISSRPMMKRKWLEKEIDVNIDDNQCIFFRFENNNCLGAVFTSFCHNASVNPWGQIVINGSQGSLTLQRLDDATAHYRLIHERIDWQDPQVKDFDSGLGQEHNQLPEAHIAVDLFDFIDSIETDRSPGASAEIATEVIKQIEIFERN
jgi:predicted dehydrogenase